jgi:hypothetical protein
MNMIEDLVRGVGWVSLKVVTIGRYSSSKSGADLFEGTVGLLVLAGLTSVTYRWFA